MMRLKGWPGAERIGQPCADGSVRRWRALSSLLALVLLGVGLAACEPTRSFERTGDGSTVYIDELSEAAKAEAREKIVQSLNRGVTVYDVGIGDELEIFFHVDRKPTSGQYVISSADKLSIEFVGDTANDRTIQVAPDGRIFLPLIGPAMAAGQTVDALARQLQERYSQVLTEPKITVNTTETHSALDNFVGLLGGST